MLVGDGIMYSGSKQMNSRLQNGSLENEEGYNKHWTQDLHVASVNRAENHILKSRAPHYNELSCLPSLFAIKVLLHKSV
jgi:hypothetical protein